MHVFDWPICSRPEIVGKGFCAGITTSRSQGHRLTTHSFTHDYQSIIAEILEIAEKLDFFLNELAFTSVQFLFNATVKRHRDDNVKKSISIALGNFSGAS